MSEYNFIGLILIPMICLIISQFILLECDFLSPSIIFNFMMFLSASLAYMNMGRWDLFIGADATIIILLGMIMFAIGDIFCKYNIKSNYRKRNLSSLVLNFNNMTLIFMIIVLFITSIFAFKEIYDLSLQVGNTEGVFNMIKSVRYPLERGEIKFDRWHTYRNIITRSLAVSSIYAFCSNYIIHNKVKFKYFFVSLMYLPTIILSTGRAEMVGLFVLYGFIFSFLYLLKNKYEYKALIKMGAICSIFGIFILLFFLLFGNFTGKVVSETRTPFVIISHYVGLSFPALDQFLQMSTTEDTLIGSNTLYGIYSNLRSLGMDLPSVNSFLPFVKFHGVDTNVYSAFKRYYEDFGILGMMSLTFFFGVIWSYIYNYMKYKYNQKYIIILYASNVVHLVMSFHDEKFLMYCVNTGFIYYAVVLYLFLKGQEILKSSNEIYHYK